MIGAVELNLLRSTPRFEGFIQSFEIFFWDLDFIKAVKNSKGWSFEGFRFLMSSV